MSVRLDSNHNCDWLRRQFLAVVLAAQEEVVCICTLSAFYHMAKQHSKGVSICMDILQRTTTFCTVRVYFFSLYFVPLHLFLFFLSSSVQFFQKSSWGHKCPKRRGKSNSRGWEPVLKEGVHSKMKISDKIKLNSIIVIFAFFSLKVFLFLRTSNPAPQYHFWDMHYRFLDLHFCFQTCIITSRPALSLPGPVLLLPDLQHFTVTFLSRKLKQTEGNKLNWHNHQDALF